MDPPAGIFHTVRKGRLLVGAPLCRQFARGVKYPGLGGWGWGGGCRDFGARQPQGKTRFLPVRGGAMDSPGLGGFVEGGSQAVQGLGRLFLFSGLEELEVTLLEGVEAGLGAAIAQMLDGAVAHAAFG
jgi:hypothetical protein